MSLIRVVLAGVLFVTTYSPSSFAAGKNGKKATRPPLEKALPDCGDLAQMPQRIQSVARRMDAAFHNGPFTAHFSDSNTAYRLMRVAAFTDKPLASLRKDYEKNQLEVKSKYVMGLSAIDLLETTLFFNVSLEDVLVRIFEIGEAWKPLFPKAEVPPQSIVKVLLNLSFSMKADAAKVVHLFKEVSSGGQDILAAVAPFSESASRIHDLIDTEEELEFLEKILLSSNAEIVLAGLPTKLRLELHGVTTIMWALLYTGQPLKSFMTRFGEHMRDKPLFRVLSFPLQLIYLSATHGKEVAVQAKVLANVRELLDTALSDIVYAPLFQTDLEHAVTLMILSEATSEDLISPIRPFRPIFRELQERDNDDGRLGLSLRFSYEKSLKTNPKTIGILPVLLSSNMPTVEEPAQE